MKYSYILLDADHTLFDFDKAEANALTKVFDYFKIQIDDSVIEVYHHYNHQLWKQLELGKIKQGDIKIQRTQYILEYLKVNHVTVEEFSNQYVEFLAEGHFLYDGALELCEYLASKYKISIVTNGIEHIQNNRILYSGIHSLLDKIIVSETVGYSKPDKRVMEYALNEIKCTDKSQVILIGDSLSADIACANNAGIDSCWYNPHYNENTSQYTPRYIVHSYDEIKKLL